MGEFGQHHVFTSEELGALLLRQREHDTNYHRDIQGLALAPRIQHLALHLAKYVGRLAKLNDVACTDSNVVRTLTDGLIVCWSVSNALGVAANDLLSKIDSASRWDGTAANVALNLAIPVGQIAKVCEAFDHLEDLHYAAELRKAILDAHAVLIQSWPSSLSNRLTQEVLARWNEIERGRVA